ALKEVEDTLNQLNDKLDESFQKVCDKIDDKLDEGLKQVDDKLDAIYKTSIEVACKPIDDDHHGNELAILGRLSLSPQILKFYGHSVVNNAQVMIFEWADRGNLMELYEKYDIPWTRKIQIAKDILLGLLFLRTVLRDLSVKLGNFGCAREVDGNSRNLSYLATYIIRWMAPELIDKYINGQVNKKVYTFNCEMFSFGMLLWELCYEKLPYTGWGIKQISNHVLNGKREKLLKGRFKNPDDNIIQSKFIKIIQD
ncbi:4743_t:CDS:2, partial [Dentiscutata heterogama]